MRHRIYSRYMNAFAAAMLVATFGTGPVLAQDQSGGASEQWTQALDQIQGYGADQRNEAVEAGESATAAVEAYRFSIRLFRSNRPYTVGIKTMLTASMIRRQDLRKGIGSKGWAGISTGS